MIAGLGAPDDPRNLAVNHDEGLSLGHPHDGGHTESLGDYSVVIGQQGEGQIVFVGEFFLTLDRVPAHADDLHALGREIGKGIAQGAGLRRATRCVRFGIKINKGGTFGVDFGQVDARAMLIDGGKLRSGIADGQGAGRSGETEERKQGGEHGKKIAHPRILRAAAGGGKQHLPCGADLRIITPA